MLSVSYNSMGWARDEENKECSLHDSPPNFKRIFEALRTRKTQALARSTHISQFLLGFSTCNHYVAAKSRCLAPFQV